MLKDELRLILLDMLIASSYEGEIPLIMAASFEVLILITASLRGTNLSNT